jgi:ubiquinone/menaquinone biosynthesis C-methylase UbiE
VTASDTDVAALLAEPKTLAPLRREGDAYVGESGERYRVEDGVVRTLRNVDPDLARELEAQEKAVGDYSDPRLLMPRYEHDMARRAVAQLFGKQPPTGNVLDAGCGIGLLGRMYPDLGLIGLDASMPLLREASTGYRLRVEGSAEALPFKTGSFDYVVALNMLHHVINPEKAVREFARVLKPGGVLVALDPRKVLPIEVAKQMLRGHDATFAPTHKAFTVEEYDRLISADPAFRIDDRDRIGLISLLSMGGLDAIKVSRFIPATEQVVNVLGMADKLLFQLPGVPALGLNLMVRATRV